MIIVTLVDDDPAPICDAEGSGGLQITTTVRVALPSSLKGLPQPHAQVWVQLSDKFEVCLITTPSELLQLNPQASYLIVHETGAIDGRPQLFPALICDWRKLPINVPQHDKAGSCEFQRGQGCPDPERHL